ncbi:YgfZ/GcvT domain-containing protein [Reinekea blandensis]|uniref:CAF17 C-terminal domain-containing protein n=1 Tax=Reinekea blandensis MED297 TaxID=314283 RepID=A4BBI6_9GAMM|nr:folate-binding protein YgfZ [Reinekea blandensis]EAR10321.1 hypothetical protein MED297_00830 [Reinekea sp. MED297] [Reinekea blandensis MED297]
MNDLQHCQLSHLSAIQLSGSDTLNFLQGQSTQDIKRLALNTPVAGGFCNVKGRLISTVQMVLVSQEPTQVLLIGERTGLEALSAHLKKYAPLFRKMTFDDQLDRLQFFGGYQQDKQTSGETVTVVPWGQNRVLYITEQPDATDFPPTETLIPSSEWAYQDVLDQILWLDGTQSAAWIPQNVSLDALDGVSFKKGCYTGQEVVARLHYKGQSKKRLFRLTFTADQSPDETDVFAGTTRVGEVIQTAVHNGQGAALAVLKTDKTGEAMTLGENRQVPVELLH